MKNFLDKNSLRNAGGKKKNLSLPFPRTKNNLSADSYVHHILKLQKIVGNQAIQRVLNRKRARGRGIVPPNILNQKVRAKTRKTFDVFMKDLNTILTNFSGKTVALAKQDFKILVPKAFLGEADIKNSPEYMVAQSQAQKVCAATSTEIKASCPKGQTLTQWLKTFKRFKKLHCKGSMPNWKLISKFLTIRGITPPGGGKSLILFTNQVNQFLETVVHEGIHRARGTSWAKHSRIGAVRYHPLNSKILLPVLSTRLDEGTVQILTNTVIQMMGKRGWFKGYNPSSYQSEIKYVQNILSRHKKDLSFLKKAYFSYSRDADVADLRSWQ